MLRSKGSGGASRCAFADRNAARLGTVLVALSGGALRGERSGLRRVTYAMLLIALGAALTPRSAEAARVMPDGFFHETIASVPVPTDFTFLPDGRMLIASKTGQVWLRNGQGELAQALDIEHQICTDVARGLLGITHHPEFDGSGGANDWIYLHHSHNKHGMCGRRHDRAPVNRISRFKMEGDTIVAASQQVLVDNVPSPNGQHDGGDLEFGNDDHLYVSFGDGGCNYTDFNRCMADNDAARDSNVLLGKILRITDEGEPAPGNPYAGRPRSEACALNGMTTSKNARHCDETFASGLRNPWRMAFNPNTASSRTVFRVHDVGQRTWEEINQGRAGADYGWNCREGPIANPARSAKCRPMPAGLASPEYAYHHRSGCKSITGGAWVPNDSGWPARFRNTYLYSDYVCNRVFRLHRRDGRLTSSRFAVSLGAGGPISIGFGPHRGGSALYYATFANGGQIRRISYTSGTVPPAARIKSTNGQVWSTSDTVAFDASASGGSGPLLYRWDFDGDGIVDEETNDPLAAHTYTARDRFEVSLTVIDSNGEESDPVSVEAFPLNSPPTATIDSAPASFAVGEQLGLTGNAQDPDGDSTTLRWEVLQWHNGDHTHPYASGEGPSLELAGPEPEDLLSVARARNYLEVRLDAEDALGLRATAPDIHAIRPRLTKLDFLSRPDGFRFLVSNRRFRAPRAMRFWEDWQVTVEAIRQRDGRGRLWVFDRWSDGGARRHLITPSEMSRLRVIHVRR